ncbi:MAG TPA: PEP/pyruvate-binding domain-containing protein [Kofleriaceae bacterium]|nr:PEP/pyruvate-binding domain-containing protein [Kofleriaceae bacterium]
MKHLSWALVVMAAVVIGARPPAHAGGQQQRAWVKAVPDASVWKGYSKTVGSDEFGKCIIDVKTNDIYFFDVNLFNIHADFVLGVLLKQAWTADNIREYNKNYERDKPRFILCYLTHHLKVDRWTYSFWEGDKIGAADVMRVKQRLAESFFVKDIVFRPDSPMQQKVAAELARRGVKTITNDEIYRSAEIQAFTRGRAIGKLHVVPVGTSYESLIFDRHDIVLLQESYPDITPVAGILATAFSTPLSHVNLRAGAWGIPNAGDKRARDKYAQLDGKIVYYEVTDTALTLREATAAEIAQLEHKIARARHVDLPPADLTWRRLAMLTRMRATDVVKYGTKAANLGEIVTANLDGVAVPPGFGVPFYYYVQHMRQNRLDARLDAILGDPRFLPDAAWRRQALEGLRRAIIEAPIDPATLDMIYKRVRIKLGGKGVFVRSSTNAEDLPGFNGAGLYDTVPNVVGKHQLGEALKTVWASLWNLRAVDEREAFGIDHHQVYFGVLIQVGVNATAAGVLVTKNLWDPTDDHGFTINAKWGLGMRVVEGQKVPEQIVFDPTNDGTKIISRADDPVMLRFDEHGGIKELPVPSGAGVILSEERARKLCTQVETFQPVFPRGVPLDVEWVLEGERFWIVQARPYVGG